MWAYSDLLGVDEPSAAAFLGEGATATISARGEILSQLGVGSLTFKAEHQNPTGSFKDRIAAMSLALIESQGLVGAIGTSSGNGGAAMAAFGARAGIPVVIFTTSGIVDGKLSQILAHGTTVRTIDRTPEQDTQWIAAEISRLAQRDGWLAFLTGHRFAPEAMRGAETIAFELADSNPGATALYVPVGGGGLLGSIGRGYQRLGRATPRLVGVQPSGCPTLRRGLAGNREPLDDPVTTSISGLQVPVLFDFGALDSIKDSGGGLAEVDDEQVWEAQAILARQEGLLVEPAGATALAGVIADVAAGRLDRDDHVVVILSGAGHKDQPAVARLAGDNAPVPTAAADIESVFAELAAAR